MNAPLNAVTATQLRRAASHPGRMTADEFLLWALDQPGRYELVNGEVVGMARERAAHARTKHRAVVALEAAIRGRGLGCEAFPDGMAVRVADGAIYEPDAQVRCGDPLPSDAVEVPDPLIVVEVLSPSTGQVDTGKKLTGYFSLPSVRHYLVLDPQDRTVIHYRRVGEGGPEDRIATRILHARTPEEGMAGHPGADLVLDPPGLTIPCEDLFEAS